MHLFNSNQNSYFDLLYACQICCQINIIKIMKSKSKVANNKKLIVKGNSHKLSVEDQQKTVVTTKQQTYSTFQQHPDIHDARLPLRAFKTHRTRKSCLEEAHFSPFSSPQIRSVTPRARKFSNPFGIKPIDCKKMQKKATLQKKLIPQKKLKKPLSPRRRKRKNYKEEQTKLAFQKEFIKRMEDKHITELSEEGFQTTFKKPIPKIQVSCKSKPGPDYQKTANQMVFKRKLDELIYKKPTKTVALKKTKTSMIKDLFEKIVQKNRNQLLGLSNQELKGVSCIMLFQRLWKTSMVKKQINRFFNPTQIKITDNFFVNNYSFKEEFPKQRNLLSKQLFRQHSKTFDQNDNDLQLTPIKKTYEGNQGNVDSKESTEKLILKNRQLYGYLPKQTDSCHQDWHSPQRNKLNIQKPKGLNLKQLQLSDELSQISNGKYRNYVESRRQLQLSSKKKKINVFNIPQSFSDKCLHAQLYQKVFIKSSQQQNKIQFLKSNYEKKKEKQVGQVNQIFSSPKGQNKSPYSELQILYTEAHDDQLCTPNKPKQFSLYETHQQQEIQTQDYHILDEKSQNKAQQSITKIAEQNNEQKVIKIQQQQKEQLKPQQLLSKLKNSLKNVSIVSQFIVEILIDQFVKQSNPNVGKKKKQDSKQSRKGRLPGLVLTQQSIRDYLEGVISFIKQNQLDFASRSLEKVNASTILKLYRGQSMFEVFQQNNLEDEDQQNGDWSIIPRNVFFDYQAEFQNERLKISEQNDKYKHFILGISKITNKCLFDCFVEFLQKQRTDSIVYPWDARANNKQKGDNTSILISRMEKAKNITARQSFKKLGRLHKKNSQLQQHKLLFNLNEQYKSEGRQWLCADQMLETRLQISEEIIKILLDQITEQILLIGDQKDERSQMDC